MKEQKVEIELTRAPGRTYKLNSYTAVGSELEGGALYISFSEIWHTVVSRR